MTNLHPIQQHHILAVSVANPGVRCFFRLFHEYWTPSAEGFAMVRQAEIEQLQKLNAPIVILDDLMQPPFTKFISLFFQIIV